MASNGGVVAESNQDPAQCSAGATVPASLAHPKPEVARKPHLPGNKPRPPVPKKPPVAQKPAPANHGSTAQAVTPTSPPNNHNSDSTSPTASARLSHPDAVTQEAAPATVTQNAGPGQSLAAKSPPPPLPKSPPKGRPQTGKVVSKPPPRPGQPPAPWKSPPPVPIKRPVGRSPVLPERRKAEQAGPSVPQREPLRSYEQVVVEDNLKAGVDDRQIAGSEHSLCKTTCSSSQKPRPYQQVVVEENCDDGSEAHCLSSAERQSARRPQSYENVVLGEKSKSQNSMPQTSALGPLRSYEDVLVEENYQPDSDLRDKQKESDHHRGEKTDTLLITGSTANSLSVDEGDGQKQTANSDASGQDGITQAADHQTDLGSKNPLTASGLHSDDVYTEVTEDKNGAPTHGAGETEPPSDPANLRVEKHSGEGSGHLLPKPLKENSFKGRPPRPCPTPPPVRPKPRKRISLLRQSLVTEEDPKEPTPPAAAAESKEPCHSNDSAPGFEAADSPVQEALYQEIDELEQPGQKLTESSSSCETESSLGPGFAGSSPGSEEVNQNQEQNCASGDQRQKLAQGSVEGVDAQGSIKDAVDSLQTVGSRAPEAPGDSGRLSPDVEAVAEQTGESGDQTGAADASRKSPEKHNPITLQDVGETSFMLKEIEQLLKVRLGSGEGASDTDSSKPAEASDTLTTSQTESTPVRPPRPRRMDKLRKLTIGSVESSSTESLTGVGQSGKKAPPKPKRKHLPGPMSRSQSDVTGMKNYIDQLKDGEEEERPSLPPRQQSLHVSSEPKPPPLPPRNKSMEHGAGSQAASSPKLSEGHVREEEKTGDRRSSAPNVGGVAPTKLVRSSTSGVRQGRKHIPRPTRKAPPPPSHPPSRPLSVSTPQSSNPSGTPSTSVSGKVPGYQKITNGSVSASDDINTVVPKTAVVGCIDSPCAAEATADHDYHEIPEHLVQDMEEKDVGQQEPTKSVEGTPPPDLPPRSYNPPSGPSEPAALTSSDPAKEEDSEAETPQDKQSDQLSAEDSTSQSSQMSSRPESFCSEVMGSLLHVVGDRHRPVSMHSSSSHSETGSGEGEVPTFDHSSASESENEDDEDRMRQKREKKVYYIAEEVVKSEQVFVDVLKLLNVDFRTFMSSKTEQAGHPIVPTETLNKILDFLPQLLSFNEMLLKDLTDRIANWEKHKKLADIFVKKGPFLKLYSSYIRNFEHATALLDETCKKHSGFGMALQQFEMSPRCANLALKHYMLKPIQRIPQYKLLLQDYLKHLTPESADYKDTLTALNIVSEVADHANESMRHGDDVQKLLEIQRSLIGQFEVIQPGRVLIKQGELMKLSRKDMQPRMFFLFSDVLLYTTPTATGYRLNNILPLQGMKVLPPKLEEFKNEFNIISTQRSFTVATSTPEEREEWLRALWNAVEENSERYHTFKAKQSEPKTSLLDKDFVLGTKAPLWVPDARVTMCMLCLAEFSITWRRHHCRGCGRIICGNCSENKAPLRYLMYKPARVCDECFEKLAREVDERLEKDQKSSVEDPCTSPGRPASTASATGSAAAAAASSDALGLSFSSIKARFQKIRRSARERRKLGLARPSVLKEVHANDEGSDMSGYLWVAKNKKWKRLWFVVKGKVLYTYKASEDMAAIESMPLLGFEVTRMTSWYQGAEPDLMFELQHQNTQPLVFKPRTTSTSSSSDRNSATDDGSVPSPTVVSPHVKSSTDTTTPRLIFRTDSAAATTKWLTVLREASLA